VQQLITQIAYNINIWWSKKR